MALQGDGGGKRSRRLWLGGLQHGSGRGVGSGGLWRGRGSGRGRLASRGRLCREVWRGLLHLALPLWLRSRGPKVLSRGTGGHGHGDNRGSWRATIRVRIHVAIVSDTGWGEGRREDGPRGDWRDCSIGTWVITGGWKVTEPAEGCEGVVESGTITVVLRKFGCKPNRKNGCHEGFGLVGEGEFVKDEEDRVNIFYGDACVVDEFRDGYEVRCIKRWGRHVVKPTPERGRFRELG